MERGEISVGFVVCVLRKDTQHICISYSILLVDVLHYH